MRCPLPRYLTLAVAALALATVTTSREGDAQQTPSSPGPGALLQGAGELALSRRRDLPSANQEPCG